MNSRKRKERGGCLMNILTVLFVLVIAAAGLGWFVVRRYMPSNEVMDKSALFGVKENQVALVLDDALQEEKGIYEDGQVYLPVEWVNSCLNQRFYWDEEEELLVYALPDSIIYADKDTQGEKGPLIKVKKDGMYLALGLVVNYTDIRTQAFATSQVKRVFIDTSWDTYNGAKVKRGGYLRQRGGIKSPIITDVAAGDSLKVLDKMERWTKVRTEDGYIGYVETRRLKEEAEIKPVSQFEAPVYTNISMDEKVRLGFHQVTRKEANSTLEEYAKNAEGMNVIVPTWFNVVENDGSYVSLADKEYVDKAHEMGLQVWAMVENVSTQESVRNLDTAVLMSSTSNRKKLIENLMKEADTYGFDGFNLDFESLKAEAGPHYVQFIREMSVACRKKGLVLSVDNYVPSSYTAFYNRKEQGIVADYVIVMAYDEHYAGGDPGSVASISYVKEGIENTLKEVPKEKVIGGVPFYTRIWTQSASGTASKAYGMKEAAKWAEENGVELTWQEDLGQYYGETEGEEGRQQVWMEEERSLALKAAVMEENDLAGIACWKLGFEPAEIWDIISGRKQED